MNYVTVILVCFVELLWNEEWGVVIWNMTDIVNTMRELMWSFKKWRRMWCDLMVSTIEGSANWFEWLRKEGLQLCVEWMDIPMVHYGTINYFGVDATLVRRVSKIFSFLVASSNCCFFFILLLSRLNCL